MKKDRILKIKEKTKSVLHITEYIWFWNYIKNLEDEVKRLSRIITDTEWSYNNVRIEVKKQYIKGVTEEVLADIEENVFNGQKQPDIVPIDMMDICHFFGYIDKLKGRIDKAIEYIDNSDILDIHHKNRHDLLNILQGSEDNE